MRIGNNISEREGIREMEEILKIHKSNCIRKPMMFACLSWDVRLKNPGLYYCTLSKVIFHLQKQHLPTIFSLRILSTNTNFANGLVLKVVFTTKPGTKREVTPQTTAIFLCSNLNVILI